ncbi:MAG: Mrp/NBP35 family ATP-binding protein [Syntrophomonas sp.]|uniref:Mrp/NBP35 family ATP-binding protein n=1 Tax=Syntrophomonas sp. TaxID=2053627 RepID=UPI00261C3C62|nr:Mrp/NBP35 family ATP-binding protein [Syntrophomonas sp.]MDD2510905.1 Mrp/NBP35 family ATP-binding protein [Syntrophomonas sp.]MDD3880108.1 Mrp/NBP35 family ATP-binding protein [Syntrophomonas sp.]MDD4625908.1 Mrp/NBP35 family ATP-binding protein [Syntrophomonas sp.]
MLKFFKKKEKRPKSKKEEGPGPETATIAPTTPEDNKDAEPSTQIGQRNDIKRVIAVISGKGGVGKSTVSSLLASALLAHGYTVGLLDADITGPSIPRVFGVSGGSMGKNDYGMVPRRSRKGLKIMSLNLFLADEELPVIWRGPRIAGAVKEFYSQVDWGTLDFLILDMPPGTGDIAITVLQNIALDGAVVVSTPQDLAFTIVRKAFHMLNKHEVPVLGVVENLTSGICPHCQHEVELFSGGGIKQWCEEKQVNYLGSLPWDAGLSYCADRGHIDNYYPAAVDQMLEAFLAALPVIENN